MTMKSISQHEPIASQPVRIIPCLDINNGRVVKGVNFVNLADAGDPVEIAQRYDEQGADELTLLDITATTEGRSHTVQLLEAIASRTKLPLIVGGGIRSIDAIQQLRDAGASKVTLSSAAIANPTLISQAADKFGPESIIVAIDAKQASTSPKRSWEVLSHGGQKTTGLDAVAWAKKLAALGAGELLVTSMDKDGTKAGFDLPLLAAITQQVAVPVIASGGAGTLQHFADAVQKGGANAVLAASIFHYGTFTIAQVRAFLQDAGIPVTR